MKQFIYNSDTNRVETRSLIPFEGHKIPVNKPINKNVSPNTIANDSDPTFYSESYLQAVKIVNNVLSMLYRRTGAYAYKRMLSDLYVDRLFIENTETKTEALTRYTEERDSIKAKLTDNNLDDDVKKQLINDRNRLTGYIQDIEKDLHVTSKSYDLVMTAYTTLFYFVQKEINIDDIIPKSILIDFAQEYIYNVNFDTEFDDDWKENCDKALKVSNFVQKEYTPYKLAYKMVNSDIYRHGKMQQAIKTADKVGVNGLTQAQNKAFYSNETNPIKHNTSIEQWYSVLTIKEREIIPYLMQGKSEREMSDIFGISNIAIHKRIVSIRRKIKQVTEEMTTEE